jgi:hypothetical protein
LAVVLAEMGVSFDTLSSSQMWYLAPEKMPNFKSFGIPVFYQQVFPFVLRIVKFGNWFLLLMNFIPISLFVTLDFIKLCQSWFVEWDVSMISLSKGVETSVHNSQLSEELG